MAAASNCFITAKPMGRESKPLRTRKPMFARNSMTVHALMHTGPLLFAYHFAATADKLSGQNIESRTLVSA